MESATGDWKPSATVNQALSTDGFSPQATSAAMRFERVRTQWPNAIQTAIRGDVVVVYGKVDDDEVGYRERQLRRLGSAPNNRILIENSNTTWR